MNIIIKSRGVDWYHNICDYPLNSIDLFRIVDVSINDKDILFSSGYNEDRVKK